MGGRKLPVGGIRYVCLKRVITIVAVVMIVVSCGSPTDEAFVPSKEGMVLTTVYYNGDDISVAREVDISVVRETVKSVKRSGKDMSVTRITQLLGSKGEVLNTIEGTTNFVDGITEIDIGGMFVGRLISGSADGAGVARLATREHNKMRLPSKIKSGEVSVDINMDLDGVNISIPNIECVAIEEITVTAGRFRNAYKMTYNVNIGRSGGWGRQDVGFTISVTEWYVKGIGVVRSEAAAIGDVSREIAELIDIKSELVGIEQKYTPDDRRLVTNISPKDGGTVLRNWERETYPAGSIVTLTAKAAPGYKFKEWVGMTVKNTRTVNVVTVGDMNVTAVFEKVDDLAMVPVKGGTFTMGCTPEQEDDCHNIEKPTHRVTVSDFSIMKYEVTQRLYEQYMGSNPSSLKEEELPVVNVSWNDVQMFIQALNEKSGKKYRLPTEAEWEFAARGGTKSKGYKYSGGNNLDDVAWYIGNRSGNNPPIGTKAPNELGIYDMSGNVREWVGDWLGGYGDSAKTDPVGPSSGIYRVYRGGSFSDHASSCRVSSRGYGIINSRNGATGFRLVLSP